jgi:hypothetical protein
MIPIDIAGPTGGHRSSQYGGEVTQNMYIDLSEGRNGVHDFPGLKIWAAKNGTDRGMHVMADVLYKLIDSTLWRISSTAVYTSLGAVSGSDRAVFADDGTNLFFTANSVLYKYNGATVSTVSQSVVTNPRSIAYINRQFIIAGDNGLFGTSNAGDGSTYNALNFAEAEVAPDPLLRPYVFSQLVYMLGSRTTELWYNSGVGNPPFSRKDTSLVNVGIAGKHAVSNTDQFLYWLGDDRKVYQCQGANARSVGSQAFAHHVEAMDNVADCIASSFVMEGQDFVLFSFPSGNQTWLFSETYSYWVELASTTNLEGVAWYATSVKRCYGKNLGSGGGDVMELDLDTYTDNGLARLRIRTLPNFNGKMIGAPSKRITVKQLRINAEVGVGLVTGQGSDPVLMCQLSPDGGQTWQAQSNVSIGVNGDYMIPVDFWDFCTGYDVRARILCSDPVYLSMFDGEVDIEVAGF